VEVPKRRIKHNNLLPWFTNDHGTLPASYLASCEKFFQELKERNKPQASSTKHRIPKGSGNFKKKKTFDIPQYP